jgi:poly-gamma-glutamate synthesis protein (capsule biosynthesis protein)
MCCLLLGSTSIIYALSGLNNTATPAAETELPQNSTAQVSTAEAPADTAKISSEQPPADSVESDPAPAADTAVQSSSDSPADKTNPSVKETTNQGPSKKPEEEQTPSTPTKPEDPTPAASITISAVGDVMAHQSNLNNAYSPKKGTYDFTGFLEYVKPYLTESDLTIGNFETVTAGAALGYTSFPSFNTPDSILTALADAGFDILSTANNHCLDRGINGLTRTIQKITQNKMINVGSSTDGKNKYVLKDVKGIKLGILAYSDLYNGNDRKLSAAQKAKYLNPVNEAQIQKDIKAARAGKADVVIVVVHWGNEYNREPSSRQTALAKKMLSWGADVILGSHPHVIQKSEIVKVNGKDKFIIYSMGNFISGYRRIDKSNRPNKIYTEDGVIVNLQIDKDLDNRVIIRNVNYIPTWVDKYYVNNRPVFKIIPIPAPEISGEYVTDYNRPFIKQSYKNTMGIMAKMR